jgi:AcrR family transcriptional regulator
MVQVRKAAKRQAILASAYRLFSRRGYVATGVAQIAAGAGVSEANLYVYFHSKLDILFGVYEPWLRERIHRLEGRVAAARQPRQRLRLVLETLWRELPADDNGFTNNLLQALSTVERRGAYRPDLLHWVEARIDTLLAQALPPGRWRTLRRGRLAHLLMMAQDGFAMAFHLRGRDPCPDATINMLLDFLLPGTTAAGAPRGQPGVTSAARSKSAARLPSGRSRARP